MKIFLFIATFALTGLTGAVPALAQALPQPALQDEEHIVTDLVVDHIDITTGFNGAELDIYGVRPVNGDVVIIVRGPDRDMTVRRKEKTVAGWRYGKEVTFDHMPSFYRVAATRSPEEMLPEEQLLLHEIGLPSLEFKPHDDESNKTVLDTFKQAFIRNQEGKELISQHIIPITPLGERFFKTTFYLPHNVPVGTYAIVVFYMQDNQIVDTNRHELFVAQVGTNSDIKLFAEDRPFSYGALCVVLALTAGWISNRLKRVL